MNPTDVGGAGNGIQLAPESEVAYQSVPDVVASQVVLDWQSIPATDVGYGRVAVAQVEPAFVER